MRSTVYIILILFFALKANGQQRADVDFVADIKSPRYELGKGPVVAIDGSHNNMHQKTTGFAAFSNLLEADGYRVVDAQELTVAHLEDFDVLVIANAIHESDQGNWERPIVSAFTSDVIESLHTWIEEGGRLLLIADHMPFAGAAGKLAEKFGFKYIDGFVVSAAERWPPETYRKRDGTLLEHEITMGIDSLAGFTGSALKIPDGAESIAVFPESHVVEIPERAWEFDKNSEQVSVDGLYMGAVMAYGEGRLAVFTEAAMFSSQIIQERYMVGFTSPRAAQNQTFVLNLLYWLSK